MDALFLLTVFHLTPPSDREIILNLYSNDFPDLTLLDLPGIIRARGPNDPKDICKTCESIVRSKIKNQDAIILAVLNAREGIRGAAEGIRLVQEEKAEERTLAVLTCIDRCDASDEIAAIMRQEKDRELPRLGHHYHACIGRDTKRTAAGERAAPEDIEAFLRCLHTDSSRAEALDVSGAEELLRADKVSEAVLTTALTDLVARYPEVVSESASEAGATPAAPNKRSAAVKAALQLRGSIASKLEETRANQDLFEKRFFAPPAPATGSLSRFQVDRNVDPRILTSELRPFLGSKALSIRLSELLTQHISLKWAPRMCKVVRQKKVGVLERIKACGPRPPSASEGRVEGALEIAVEKMTSEAVAAFLQLLGERKADILSGCVANAYSQISKSTVDWRAATRVAQDFTGSGTGSAACQIPTGATQPFLDAVAAVLRSTEKQHPVHLGRFVIFARWLQTTVKIEVKRRQVEFRKELDMLIDALAPDVIVPGVNDQHRQQLLCQALRDALPRLVIKQLGDNLFAALPALLSKPPRKFSTSDFSKETPKQMTEYDLLAETRENANLRVSNEKLLAALEQVSTELQRYGDEKPRPEPSKDHLCPISLKLMIDPVTAADGHVYDRASIEEWMKGKLDVRSPKTGELLPHKVLTPSHIIRSQIIEWREKHGIKAEDDLDDS